LLLAVVRRVSKGRSPFSPDKQHLHHRLLQRGHSQRRAVALMYSITALVSFTVVALAFVTPWKVFAVAIPVAVVLTYFVIHQVRTNPGPVIPDLPAEPAADLSETSSS
jgi:UDP-GlcNAc:undecaprenyl-phosphate GlcNAc-1-phosphate transferase